jgi:hypothetical protein
MCGLRKKKQQCYNAVHALVDIDSQNRCKNHEKLTSHYADYAVGVADRHRWPGWLGTD